MFSAMFSAMAELNLRKEGMLYREQMRRALIITSGWMAGRPLSGQ